MYEAIIDIEDQDLANLTWQASVGWWERVYASRIIQFPKEKAFTVMMHHIIVARKLGRYPQSTEVVDHIDGDPRNNRRNNLRIVTATENAANTTKRKNNTSGYKGVSYVKARNCWKAVIGVNRKKIHFGSNFKTKEDAARAYKKGVIDLFGKYARYDEVEDDNI